MSNLLTECIYTTCVFNKLKCSRNLMFQLQRHKTHAMQSHVEELSHCCSSKAAASLDTYYQLVQNYVYDFSNVGDYGMA